jgi:Uma2 family endonuclease
MRLPYPDIVAVYDMTEQEYLDWDQEGGLADWIDGKVYQYMTASSTHQEIVNFLASLLRVVLEVSGGGRVLTGPYAMRTVVRRTWREPDLIAVTREHEKVFTDAGATGGADLAIEVVSPGSRKRDMADKLTEYEAAGIPEYWVIDPRPRRQRAFFYVLVDGRYEERFADADGIYRSAAFPELWLRVAWLWEPQPNTVRALVEVVGLEALAKA